MAARKKQAGNAKTAISRKKVISKNVKEKVKIVAKKKKGAAIGIELPSIPVVAVSKRGSKKKGVSQPVNQGSTISSGVTVRDADGLRGGRGRGSNKRGSGGRRSSSGVSSSTGDAGLAGGRGRGGSSNRGAGKASGRGKRNSNKFSPPPTDTDTPSQPEFLDIRVITESKGGSKKKRASLPVNSGRGGSGGMSSNSGAGLAGGRGRGSSRGGSSNRGAGKASGRGKRASDKSFSPPPTDSNMPSQPEFLGIPVTVNLKGGSKKKSVSLPVNGGRGGTGLEDSIKENQINLEAIEDNKLIQKGEKIIKANQICAPENMDEPIALNPPEQTVQGNLPTPTPNNDMTVAMPNEKANDALKSSENWALVKSTIMKNHDTIELNKSLYKWNKSLFKDNLQLSSIVQLGYEDQRKLRHENAKLKGILATYEEKIQKMEQMNRSLWQQLDQKTLESEVRYNSKNQQFLLRKNFKDLTEKVKSECDEKCKKLERELISVTKENDHLNKRLEKLTDLGQKQIPKKVQTNSTVVPVIDIGNDSKAAVMPTHRKPLVSVSDAIGGTEILIGKSNKVEEIYIQSDSDNDCMIVGEDGPNGPKRQSEIEKVLQQGEPKPNGPPCENMSSEDDIKMFMRKPIEYVDTSDDSNDEICIRSETSISIEGNITTTEDELEKKEFGLGESHDKLQSEPAEDNNLQYLTLIKQEIKVEDRTHSQLTQLPSHAPFKKVPPSWTIVPEILPPPSTNPVMIGTLGPSSHQSVRARLAENPTEIVPVHLAAPCQKLKIEQKILENANKRKQLSACNAGTSQKVRNLSSSSSSASSEADDEEISSCSPSDAKYVPEDVKPDIKPDGRNIKPDPEAGTYVHQIKQRVSRIQDVSPAFAKNLKLVTARTSEQLKGKTVINYQPLGSQPKVGAKPKTKAKTRRISKHTPPSKRIKIENPISSENTNTVETQVVPANNSLETHNMVPTTPMQQPGDTQSWAMMQQMFQQMRDMQRNMQLLSERLPDMQMMNPTRPTDTSDKIETMPDMQIMNPTDTSQKFETMSDMQMMNPTDASQKFETMSDMQMMNPTDASKKFETMPNMKMMNPKDTSDKIETIAVMQMVTPADTSKKVETMPDMQMMNPTDTSEKFETMPDMQMMTPADTSKKFETMPDMQMINLTDTSEKIERMSALNVESSSSSVGLYDNMPCGTLDMDLHITSEDSDSSEEEELSVPSSPIPENFDVTSPPLNKWTNFTQETNSNEVGLSVIFLNKLVGKPKMELDEYLNGTTQCVELNCPSDLPPDTGLARATYQFVFSDRENMEKESSERDLPLSHAAQKALTVIQILAKTDIYRNLPSLALDFFDTQIVSANGQYDAFQIGGSDIHSNLVKLGRFYGALSRQFNLKEEIKTIVFDSLYWRPPHAFSLTYGILCLNPDIFSGLPYEKFGLTERALIYALAYPPKFNDAKHCRPVQSLLKQSLCLVIPELTYEQFVDSMLEEMKGLEEDNILKKATRAMSMLCLQMNLKCFEQFMTTRIAQWVLDWQHSKITDAVLACFINVIGNVGYDSPKHGDISGLQTLVAALKRVNEDIMDPILKDAIQCSYSKIENKIMKMKNTKERTLRYETNNTGRIKKKSKKKKNKRFKKKNRPIMDQRQREMVKAAEELFSI